MASLPPSLALALDDTGAKRLEDYINGEINKGVN